MQKICPFLILGKYSDLLLIFLLQITGASFQNRHSVIFLIYICATVGMAAIMGLVTCIAQMQRTIKNASQTIKNMSVIVNSLSPE